jgi:hypothetical protein
MSSHRPPQHSNADHGAGQNEFLILEGNRTNRQHKKKRCRKITGAAELSYSGAFRSRRRPSEEGSARGLAPSTTSPAVPRLRRLRRPEGEETGDGDEENGEASWGWGRQARLGFLSSCRIRGEFKWSLTKAGLAGQVGRAWKWNPTAAHFGGHPHAWARHSR